MGRRNETRRAQCIAPALRQLLKEVEGAAVAAGEAAERARARALDPTEPATDDVRHEMEAAAFNRDRLSAALPRRTIA
jgi:hypothetical protein